MIDKPAILNDEKIWKAAYGDDIGSKLAYEAEEQGSPPIIQYYCSTTGKQIAKAQRDADLEWIVKWLDTVENPYNKDERFDAWIAWEECRQTIKQSLEKMIEEKDD